jgi:hypothetical protein
MVLSSCSSQFVVENHSVCTSSTVSLIALAVTFTPSSSGGKSAQGGRVDVGWPFLHVGTYLTVISGLPPLA